MMPFLTFFTRHTATTAAVPERQNGPDMNATGESTVAASAPVVVDAVINEKTSVELEDDSASDSSPTDPPMQSESPASDLDSQPLPPLGVLTSLSTIPSLSQVAAAMLDRKDQRAYEFSRQRAKKPADREKAREQKIKQRHAAVMGMGDPRARGRPAKMPLDAEGKPVGNGRREKVAGDDAKAGVDATTTAAMTPSARKDRELGTGARRVHEVRLEDLLRTAKIRKQKGTCTHGGAP